MSTIKTKNRIFFILNWIEGSNFLLSGFWIIRCMIAKLSHSWFLAYLLIYFLPLSLLLAKFDKNPLLRKSRSSKSQLVILLFYSGLSMASGWTSLVWPTQIIFNRSFHLYVHSCYVYRPTLELNHKSVIQGLDFLCKSLHPWIREQQFHLG
jgi:hypothetical protein